MRHLELATRCLNKRGDIKEEEIKDNQIVTILKQNKECNIGDMHGIIEIKVGRDQ